MPDSSGDDESPEIPVDLSQDTLGGRIVRSRENLGLSTAQLARRLGVESKTLSLWETDRDEPRPNRLATLAGLLNVSVAWLLTEDGEGPSDTITKTDLMRLGERVDTLSNKAEALADELKDLREGLDSYESFHED